MIINLLKTISSVFVAIYTTIYTSFGYQPTALITAAIFGVSTFAAMFCIIAICCPPPDRQIKRTWNFISNDKFIKERFLSKKASGLEIEEKREAKYLDKQKWIEESYRRLGSSLRYEDYKKSVNTMMYLAFGLCAAMCVLSMVAGRFFLILGIFALCAGLLFADTLSYKLLKLT